MIRSMTGYGRVSQSTATMDVVFEIKCVNNRFLDCSVRLPRIYGYLEEKIKKCIQASFSRGKIDVSLSITETAGQNGEIQVDEALMENYLSALRLIRDRTGLRDDLTVTSLARMPDLLTRRQCDVDEDAVWSEISPIVEKGVAACIRMRETEGMALKNDLSANLDLIDGIAKKVETLSPVSIAKYKARLEDKIRETLADRQIDEARLLTEVAIFADRIAVDEELTRLHSHIAQFRNMLESSAPVGRKLDFLTQEMNREINTTGSKCSELEITRLVVEGKGILEKIREQIQNVE